jgi:hypothetical protein
VLLSLLLLLSPTLGLGLRPISSTHIIFVHIVRNGPLSPYNNAQIQTHSLRFLQISRDSLTRCIPGDWTCQCLSCGDLERYYVVITFVYIYVRTNLDLQTTQVPSCVHTVHISWLRTIATIYGARLSPLLAWRAWSRGGKPFLSQICIPGTHVSYITWHERPLPFPIGSHCRLYSALAFSIGEGGAACWVCTC